MEYHLEIAGLPCIADYSYKILVEGVPMRMPDLHQPGEPAEPAECEVTIEKLREDGAAGKQPLDAPKWLLDRVEALIAEDDNEYHRIMRDARPGL